MIRTFIAVELPPDVKQALAALEAKLKAAAGGAPVKWVDPENIHLTLKFLGDVDISILEGIAIALREAARGINPFSLEISGTGVFSNPQRVQVIWVGLNGQMDKLNQLQKRIEIALVPLGFKEEGRGFTPHLTLARVKDYAEPGTRQKLGQVISKTAFEAKCAVKVNSFHLIKSQLTRERPIYTKISTIQLK